MFYGHGMTVVIIALYRGGVKLCRVELPGFLHLALSGGRTTEGLSKRCSDAGGHRRDRR